MPTHAIDGTGESVGDFRKDKSFVHWHHVWLVGCLCRWAAGILHRALRHICTGVTWIQPCRCCQVICCHSVNYYILVLIQMVMTVAQCK